MRRKLFLSLLTATCAACASASYQAPRQEIPAARFEPVTAGGDPSALRKLNEDRLAAARDRFRDLDPKGWQGSGPWWLRYAARLVPYVDGETVLIGVGEVSGSDSAARKAAAADKARAEAARAFSTVLGRIAQTRTGAPPVPAELKLRRLAIDATYELGDRTWALALCDRDCLEASGRAVRINLTGVALQPGEP